MKVSIFSKVSVIFFVAFLFVNDVFCAEEELPQRVVYVNGSYLLPLIRGYKKVMADISSIHEQKKLELQKEYSDVATVQGELDERAGPAPRREAHDAGRIRQCERPCLF